MKIRQVRTAFTQFFFSVHSSKWFLESRSYSKWVFLKVENLLFYGTSAGCVSKLFDSRNLDISEWSCHQKAIYLRRRYLSGINWLLNEQMSWWAALSVGSFEIPPRKFFLWNRLLWWYFFRVSEKLDRCVGII